MARSARPWTRKIRLASADGGTPSAPSGRTAPGNGRPQRRTRGTGRVGSERSPIIRSNGSCASRSATSATTFVSVPNSSSVTSANRARISV